MFKRKWLPIWVAMLILIVIGYYGYRSDERLRVDGRYSVAVVTQTRIARNGIRVWSSFKFKGRLYSKEGVHPIPEVTLNDVGKRFFILFLPYDPEGHSMLTSYKVPDSIMSAPPEGWDKKWMKEHFPDVVKP